MSHPFGMMDGMNGIDRALADLATAQRQVFTRRQAVAMGLTPSALYRRTASGLLVAYGPHTLHFAGVTLDFRGRLLAGLLDLGPAGLVSAESAAASQPRRVRGRPVAVPRPRP